MTKKNRFSLLKSSIVLGVLLGVALKIYSFIRTEKFVCGIRSISECGILDFLKDSLIWIIITAISVLLIAFGAKYLIFYSIEAVRNFKLPKTEKKMVKVDKKEESKKEKTEERPKKVIKI